MFIYERKPMSQNNYPKTILITGCSSGIGFETALLMREKGWRVFATTRKQADLIKLKNLGFNDALHLDLDDSASIRQAVKDLTIKTNGQLTALCNNAAYGLPAALEDVSREAMRAQFETNLFGTHELTCLILPMMRNQNYGRIIQISSVLGFVAMALRGPYNASKYALEGLSDTLRLELEGTNIKVTLIEPGPIESAFRMNAQKAFDQWIDAENSVFAQTYQMLFQQRIVENAPIPFTLPSTAVAKIICQIASAKHPKIRYYITTPTYLFGYLKRILSAKSLDFIIKKTQMSLPSKKSLKKVSLKN